MASFQIRWRNPALGELERIDRSAIPAIIERVDALAGNPFPPQSKKLKDRHGQRRLRVRGYRVLYEVDLESRTVWIAAVGHPSGIYR